MIRTFSVHCSYSCTEPTKIRLKSLNNFNFSLQQEIQSKRNRAPSLGELVEIPQKYKGLVMGTGGDNLRDISTQTGAKVIRKDGEVYIASGTEQQRQQAKLYIGTIIVSLSLHNIYINLRISVQYFTITVKILARSLANFCCQ